MVYLLCFHSNYKHAKHYLGYCDDKDGGLEKRIAKHRKGTGARLMEVISQAGIGFDVARTWPHCDRNFERRLKNRKNAKKLCPICSARPTVMKAIMKVDIETRGPNNEWSVPISCTFETIEDSYDPTKPYTVADL